MSDIIAVISWYLISLALAVVGGLIGFRILNKLPDRGLGMGRIIGLLAVGTVVWWVGTVGILPNTGAGNIGAIVLVLVFGLWINRGKFSELGSSLRENRNQLIIVELLFVSCFAIWSYVRANSPDIVGTEKPMELAFLNAISTGDRFPPADPWLSGFAISYYYFGFVLAGVLTQISGVITSVAFNLTSAFWFGLVVSGAYSLSFNLISLRAGRSVYTWPLLGPVMLAITGNIEGFLELLHSRQLFWRGTPETGLSSNFWTWLDIKTLVEPPMGQPTWIPERHWWWWRASRVVRDLNIAGIDHEVIDEFPFFSFLLADIHPHVLTIPFALLAITFAFHLLLSDRVRNNEPLLDLSANNWRRLTLLLSLVLGAAVLAGLLASGFSQGMELRSITNLALRSLLVAAVWVGLLNFVIALLRAKIPLELSWLELTTGGWILGSMAFLNTWDFPIYLGILFFVLLLDKSGFAWRKRLLPALTSSGSVLILGVLLFLPWYPSFSSQAGGILPNLGFPTKLQHFFVMFAPLYVPIAVWLVWRQRRARTFDWKSFIAFTLGIPLLLWVLSWTVAAGVSLAGGPEAIGAGLGLIGVDSTSLAIRTSLGRHISRIWTALFMAATVSIVWLLLQPANLSEAAGDGERAALHEPSARFSALLVATGALLVIGPEFLYLKDLFGTRMNTVFKFYFASWIIWSVAAAYLSYELRPRARAQLARLLIFIPLVLGMFYPIMGLISRAQGFQSAYELTLDGAAHLESSHPEDARAIAWINENELEGVVVEAVGGSYSQYARIATHTGLTTVLGWEFHQVQWRGSVEAQGSRKADIERLYSTSDWMEAQEIVLRYAVDFVYIGPLERSSYGAVRLQKFEAFMSPIYQQGDVTIFSAQQRLGLQ